MKTVCIIPARMGSSRFPGKPLAKIHGMPMIGHVYYRCQKCALLEAVYVATCDREIKDYVESIGGNVIMTQNTHERCTDRTVEALTKIEEMTQEQLDIVLMIQGDEPMITPQMLNQALQPMLDNPEIPVLNLMSELQTEAEHQDPNEVKVVVDLQSNALYFSREPIPFQKKVKQAAPTLKQVCVIPFRRDFLLTYAKMEPTPLEIAESVDMMRILEHGYSIKMIATETFTYAVDTPEDLAFVEKQMRGDLLMQNYILNKGSE